MQLKRAIEENLKLLKKSSLVSLILEGNSKSSMILVLWIEDSTSLQMTQRNSMFTLCDLLLSTPASKVATSLGRSCHCVPTTIVSWLFNAMTTSLTKTRAHRVSFFMG